MTSETLRAIAEAARDRVQQAIDEEDPVRSLGLLDLAIGDLRGCCERLAVHAGQSSRVEQRREVVA